MVKTNIKDLPFTEAVIGDIEVNAGYLYFTVYSQNCHWQSFKVREPKNKPWKESDAYTRTEKLAVIVVPYTSAAGKDYAYLHPNYDKNIKDKSKLNIPG